jgi:hypothetical protein
MRHLLHFGLFVVALTAVTQADAQDRRRGDRQTTVYTSSRPAYDARRAYFDQRQDFEQIVRITERWEEATARRDRHAQSKVNRRLDAWLEREIRESVREPRNHGYTRRVRVLSDELAMLERHRRKGNGHNGYGHGRGHQARGHAGYYGKKARILNELVELSERQVHRARANVRYPYQRSFANR